MASSMLRLDPCGQRLRAHHDGVRDVEIVNRSEALLEARGGLGERGDVDR